LGFLSWPFAQLERQVLKSPSPPRTAAPLIDLQTLQLDDARALLKHDAKNSGQEAGESATA